MNDQSEAAQRCAASFQWPRTSALEGLAAMLQNFLLRIDRFSMAVGHAFAWCILILTLGTSYEVFMRYVLEQPHQLGVRHELHPLRRAVHHVGRLRAVAQRPRARRRALPAAGARACRRASSWCSTSSSSIPGVTALIIAGYGYAHDSFGYREVSVNSPVGVPIWQLKALIPLGRHHARSSRASPQVIRCILCIRDGRWPRQLHDVEELESVLSARAREAGSQRRVPT